MSLHYQIPTSRPANKTYIYFKSGSKHITLHLEDLAYIQSKGGLVILMDMDLNSYTTQFSSMNEIDFNLHESLFLRVNRQYIINRSIIKSVHETKNRKLLLYLDKGFSPTAMPILVSRHKRKDVIKWFAVYSKK
ncbi:LytR/AlgR family response regulator transcription factor [Reichenbachiella faecimaris]|nr:LytTR family DNA-binding domain-containing protein [Reichenbachiella faecimaris]